MTTTPRTTSIATWSDDELYRAYRLQRDAAAAGDELAGDAALAMHEELARRERQPGVFAREHVFREVRARLLVCTCGAVLIDVPDDFPINGPRYLNSIEYAAHAAHAEAEGLGTARGQVLR